MEMALWFGQGTECNKCLSLSYCSLFEGNLPKKRQSERERESGRCKREREVEKESKKKKKERKNERTKERKKERKRASGFDNT